MSEQPFSWAEAQRRMRDGGAYGHPHFIDSTLVDPETRLPMNEEQARAYSDIERKAWQNRRTQT